MTTASPPDKSATSEGTVFDIGYQHYTGPREGRNRARYAVFKDGVRIAFGLGRGPRAKVLPWLFVGVLVTIAFIMALVVGAVFRFGGAEALDQLDLPSHSDFYGIASIFFFVFAAVVAPELLCPDRRDGVINLYLVRPLTGSDYIVSRWAAFLAVTLFVAWLPQLVLLVGLNMGRPEPLVYFLDHWLDIPRIFVAGAAMAIYTTTLAMLVAAFTTRRAYAAVFLVGLFLISTAFTTGLAQEIGGTAGQWMSMFNLTNIPVHINDLIFNEVSVLTEDAPARELSASTLVIWYLAWVIVPGTVLWQRYKRLTP